jgi:hypothetical protein
VTTSEGTDDDRGGRVQRARRFLSRNLCVGARFQPPAGPSRRAGNSAAAGLGIRARVLGYTRRAAPLPREHIRVAALGSVVQLALVTVVSLVLQHPDAPKIWDMLWSETLAVADATLLSELALPLAALAVTGLVLDAVMALRQPRLPIAWHLVCAAQLLVAITTAILAVALVVDVFWVPLFILTTIAIIGAPLAGVGGPYYAGPDDGNQRDSGGVW